MEEDIKMYYLYKHTTIDTHEVFYIGRGTKRKNDLKFGTYTRAHSKNRNIFWKHVAAKHKYIVDILMESNDFQFICEKEIELIKFYGRRNLGLGTLVNLSDGGETGSLGRIYKPTKESIEKMRNSLIGRKMSEDFGINVSKRMKGNKYRVGHKHSEEIQKQITEKVQVPVYMYNLNGDPVENFKSVKSVADKFNVHTATIIQCLKGIQQQTHGYQFRYEYYDKIDKVSYKISTNSKIYHRNLLTGEEFIYKNIRDASDKSGIEINKIRHNVRGESKIVEKFNVFKRIENE